MTMHRVAVLGLVLYGFVAPTEAATPTPRPLFGAPLSVPYSPPFARSPAPGVSPASTDRAWQGVAFRVAWKLVKSFVKGVVVDLAADFVADRLTALSASQTALADLSAWSHSAEVAAADRAELRRAMVELQAVVAILEDRSLSDARARRAIEQRLGNVERWAAEWERRMAAVDRRLVVIEMEQARLRGDLRALRRTVLDHEGRIVRLEGQVANFEGRFVAVEGRVGRLEQRADDNDRTDARQDRGIEANRAAILRETRYQRHLLGLGLRAGVGTPLDAAGTPDLAGGFDLSYALDDTFEVIGSVAAASVRPPSTVSSQDTLVWDSVYLGVGVGTNLLPPGPVTIRLGAGLGIAANRLNQAPAGSTFLSRGQEVDRAFTPALDARLEVGAAPALFPVEPFVALSGTVFLTSAGAAEMALGSGVWGATIGFRYRFTPATLLYPDAR